MHISAFMYTWHLLNFHCIAFIDIFVFPSFSEGLGLVLLEAMSYSKICITRNILPMTNYIDENSGYLFDNVNELSNSIELAIKDLKDNTESIQKKLINIEKKLEKSSVDSIVPIAINRIVGDFEKKSIAIE